MCSRQEFVNLRTFRRTDFDYAVAAGWITPAACGQSQITRRRAVDVPLYRVRDVEALLELPGVDWEAVRAARPAGTERG